MKTLSFLFSAILLLLTALPATAVIESRVTASLTTAGAPLDVAASPDGKRTYVLGAGGRLQVFRTDGELQDEVQVDPSATAIHVGGRKGEDVWLATAKGVQVLKLSFAVDIDTSGSPFLGNPQAPVTVVLFSDFQCPYCARMEKTVARLLETYPEEVRVVFKHFPLRNHRYASLAALGAIAADRQGKFWQYHDAVFAAQKQLNQQKILDIARQVGLDIGQFTRDIGSEEVKGRLAADVASGKEAGVSGTPTVFVNGREPDNLSFEAISGAVQRELAASQRHAARQ